MFSKIKQRFRDMSTIKALCLGAEKHANANGQKEPGAEHFVLAALELPDGTARKAFDRIHIDPEGFRAAITQQYQDALRNIGIEMPQHSAISDATAPIPPGTGLYNAQPSAQALMHQLVHQRKVESNAPLLGAHVILAVTSAQYGVAVRALQAMGVDLTRLAEAATTEINALRTV
ncbi:MAG: Clp protease N-terminal domain-containing protein [Gammaproteobacteria bacterium]|nr:Clp protease N-terminal domain-containing protein [Gammaproteobacteria bacterium]